VAAGRCLGPHRGRAGVSPNDSRSSWPLVRGVIDDGKILNIAADYIASGIRHRASEIEVARKLASEVDAERGMTPLDRTLLAEQRDQGLIDLRPGAGSFRPGEAA
jgi:hypothetical protein